MKKTYCLATVTCDNFVLGTEVLIYSFLKYNAWFAGDIVIFIDHLSSENKARLSAHYPVKFINRSEQIEQATNRLRKHLPQLRADLHLRLLSLEILRLRDYEKLVFLDSDGMCCGDIKEVFEHPSDFLAAPDGFAYEHRANKLLAHTQSPLLAIPKSYGQSELTDSFNSGFMAVSKVYLTGEHYQGIVRLIDDFSLWRNFGLKGFTDQMLFNIYFKNKVQLTDGRYNFMPFIEQYIHQLDKVTLLDAKFLHFAGVIKPWFNYDDTEILELAPHYLKYLHLWRDIWDECTLGSDTQFAASRITQQYHWTENAGATLPSSIQALTSEYAEQSAVKLVNQS
ncbi:glycosyltransferase family 8 protein [Pseudoalteromonas sp. T1lg23B]|uniref:glycosyltransferase family 8 protein n=1 Tax=Pseudoalteromonas sp. T1lg23B TaxID=2077097 RepID=UPI000CF60DCA|nr:glycosyltransferase [Pseudoalteromonas sp. T1lg23B]